MGPGVGVPYPKSPVQAAVPPELQPASLGPEMLALTPVALLPQHLSRGSSARASDLGNVTEVTNKHLKARRSQ